MDSERRRRLLRALGVAGATGLAGCQGSDDSAETTADDESTTSTASASSFDPTFDLRARGTTGADTSRIHVTGTVSADRPLSTVELVTENASAEIDVDGESASLDVSLPVSGGRQYRVELTAVGADGATADGSQLSNHVPIHVDPVDTDRVVGTHYYQWYDVGGQNEDWTDRTVSTPALGEYTATNLQIVDQHLKWCLEHGITWLAMSWWGPDSPTDTALTETILDMERFQDVSFSVDYETVGRMEKWNFDLDEPAARERLADDFAYLDETFFGRENYRRVDGRPVVFFYVSHALSGDVAGAFEEATADIDADPYVLADVPFASAPDAYPITEVADGLTSYNPYTARSDIEDVFHDRYDRGNKLLELGARAGGFDYTPVVIPGYDDTGLPAPIREDNPVLSASPDRFARVCEQVNPHLEGAEGVLVTSFNEWYEDTQVEPGEQYGTDYLELVRDELATGESSGFDPEGTLFKLEFDRSLSPNERDSRKLSFMLNELTFRDGSEELAAYDVGADPEPLYLKGVYDAESNRGETWRWLGGPDAEAVCFVETDISDAETAVLTGRSVPDTTIEADVFLGGTKTGHLTLDDQTTEYTVSLA